MSQNLKKNYTTFGILQIHHSDLYDGKLKVLYLTGSPFPKVKSQKVSPDLQSLLLDLIETNFENEIDDQTVQRLSERERNIFHTLLKGSGLQQRLKYTLKPRTIADIQTRFELLQGSIEAGNDSKDVINEAIDLLKLLMLAGKVNADEGNEIINSFA